MLAIVVLWILGSWVFMPGTNVHNDIHYGAPRTYQVDAVVGHNEDSLQNPTHFIVLNYHNKIVIHEYKAGDPAKSIEYNVPYSISGTGRDLVPVSIEFRDLNGDKRPDMIIIIHGHDHNYEFT